MLIGITRVRNEALIIADTMRHMLGYCDRIIAYDDASTDETAAIMAGFDHAQVIRGDNWRTDRKSEETRHRAMLLDRAKAAGADWCFCFDADERPVGELPDMAADAYTLRLFDGYLTPESKPYKAGRLADLPRAWGPEYRDIVMLFRPDAARYDRPDQRAPTITGQVRDSGMQVKHYGKCLSVEHWEETCKYYAEHFPEPYRSKWQARKGKAIHHASDFCRPLYDWPEVVKMGVRLK